MTEAQAKRAAKDFSPSNAQKRKARENALDKNVNTSKGTIIIKPQLCGKYCGTCPHGPYAWHVCEGNWTYLGAVGGGIGTTSVGKTNETEESEKTESPIESISLAPQINGELDDGMLEVKLGPTGNKKTVAKISGTSEQYGLDREWVTEYGEKTGTVELEEGDLIESTRYTHSGKNKTRNYLKYTNEELVKISEGKAKTAAKKKEATPKRQEKRAKRQAQKQARKRDREFYSDVQAVEDGNVFTVKTTNGTRTLTKETDERYVDEKGTEWLLVEGSYIAPKQFMFPDKEKKEKIESVE